MSSLGNINTWSTPVKKSMQASNPNIQIVSSTLPTQKHKYSIIKYNVNFHSKFAIFSLLSLLSMISMGSLFSVLSVGSVLSVMSIGSTLSVLSVGSVSSVLSIGSNGCYFRFFANCRAPYPNPTLSFQLRFTDDVWDTMSACTFDEYQKFKKFEPVDNHKCDYQPAQCSFVNIKETTKNVSDINCRIRRKGFTTWEEMNAKPSFKLKFDDDIDFGTIDGVHMKVDELTLNNMKFSDSWSGNREVEAYELFRQIGYRNMPVATHAEVNVFRNDTHINKHSYAMIQNVNDGGFMKTYYNNEHPNSNYDNGGYMLFEVDNRGLEFKKGKKNFKTNKDAEIGLFETIINRESDILEFMDTDDVIKYFIGEELTGNWDGACLTYIPNNYYIAVSQNETNTPKIRYLPKGMDRVFQGCGYDIAQSMSGGMMPPYCGPMQKILYNESTRNRYEHLRQEANLLASYKKRSCAEDIGTLSIIIILNVVSVLLTGLVIYGIKYVNVKRWIRHTAKNTLKPSN